VFREESRPHLRGRMRRRHLRNVKIGNDIAMKWLFSLECNGCDTKDPAIRNRTPFRTTIATSYVTMTVPYVTILSGAKAQKWTARNLGCPRLLRRIGARKHSTGRMQMHKLLQRAFLRRPTRARTLQRMQVRNSLVIALARCDRSARTSATDSLHS
jgi:hypothetical protein